MIMRLEFDREASNRKTYGVNLDALRLAHTREPAAQSSAGRPATSRPSGPASQAAAANAQRCVPQPGLPESLRLESLGSERTQQPGGVAQRLRLAKKGASHAKSWGLAGSAQLTCLKARHLCALS